MFTLQPGLLAIDITKPPPPIDDSFPHSKLLEQLRQSDKVLVKDFLSSRADTVNVSGNKPTGKVPVDISAYRSELREALLVLEGLKHSKIVLDSLCKTQEDPKWNDELDRTKQMTCTLQCKLVALEDSERLASLAKKLAVRKKKRAWQNRRNARLRKEYEKSQAEREQRMEEISRWESEWKDRLEKEQAARDELHAKTLILADVRRRKASAKRYLSRFEKSIQLNKQRQDTFGDLTEGRRTGEANGERYRRDIDALIGEWKLKLSDCIREEKRLKDDLARRSTGNEARRRENRWRKALFGDAAALANGRANQSGYKDMINIRWAWDTYVLSVNLTDGATKRTSAEKGSSVPKGWVFPPEDPQPEWAIFRENKEVESKMQVAASVGENLQPN